MANNSGSSAEALGKMKLAELQALAAQRGLKGTSRMRKAELAQALSGGAPAGSAQAASKQKRDKAEPMEAPSTRSDASAERPRDGQRRDRPRRQEDGSDGAGTARQRGDDPARGADTPPGAELDIRSAVAQDLAQERSRREGGDRGRRSGTERQPAPSQGASEERAPVQLEEIALPEGGDGNRNRGRRDRNSRRRGRNQGQAREGGQGGGQRGRNQGQPDNEPVDESQLIPIAGIVDIQSNHAFVRTSGYLPGDNDVYVTLGNVRRWGLRRGDAVVGAVRPAREGGGNRQQKYNALVRVDSVNGMTVEQAAERRDFAKLTPEYPREQLRMETTPKALTSRMIDLVAPVGKGQRGLIVSPPKAGKTMIIQQMAKAIEINNPNVHLMVVLVDERPEEVTDMRSIVKGEVIASTFDRPASDHTTVAELAIERAKRLVELGQDVVVLLDSITRLSRAYNLAAPASGRILSGGVDAAALYPPKKFFGAARNLREGGSLTIIASALVETGSKMDEVIFEEFKGTGNMELRLSRALADRRIFPAIDINASGTRREELLLKPEELAIMWKLRRALGSADQQSALESVLGRLKDTQSNAEFLMQVVKTTSD